MVLYAHGALHCPAYAGISRSVCAIWLPCWRTAWCQWTCSIPTIFIHVVLFLPMQCAPWKDRSCCTDQITEDLHINPTWHNFNWNHCDPPLSSTCEAWMRQDLCFYECSPNVGPWLVPVSSKGCISDSTLREISLVLENWMISSCAQQKSLRCEYLGLFPAEGCER